MRKRYNSGIGLLDVILIITVLSLLILPILKMMEIKDSSEKDVKLHGTIEDLSEALNKYALEYGRYPLPADPSLPITNANVFKRVPTAPGTCSSSTGAGITFAGTASATGVICRNRTSTDFSSSRRVFIGALPVSELGLPVELGLDEYGNKFTYVVTRALTSGTFSDAAGRVVMRDQFGADKITDAHFAIIGHGENGVGGFGPTGVLNGSPTICPNTSVESMNNFGCRSGASHTAGIVRQLYQPSIVPNTTLDSVYDTVFLGNTASYYDDGTVYKKTVYGKIWASQSTGRTLFTFSGKVGVGYTDGTWQRPFDDFTIQTGNLRVTSRTTPVAEPGNLLAPRLCDNGVYWNPNCFRTTDIAAPLSVSSAIYCSGKALDRISQSSQAATMTCHNFPISNPSNPVPTCTNGIAGHTVGGGLICLP